MKRYAVIISILIMIPVFVFAQNNKLEKFIEKVDSTRDQRKKIDLLSNGGFNYNNPDSSFAFAQRALILAQSIDYEYGIRRSQRQLGFSSWVLGDYATSIKLGMNLLDYAIQINDTNEIVNARAMITNSYRDLGDYKEALKFQFEQTKLTGSTRFEHPIHYAAIGSLYLGLEKYDSAMFYLNKANNLKPSDSFMGWIALISARTLQKLDKDSLAFEYYKKSISDLTRYNNLKDLTGAFNSLAEFYEEKFIYDSTVFYANKALQLATERNFIKEKTEALHILSRAHEPTNKEEALRFYKLAIQAKDFLYSQEKQRQVSHIKFNEELRESELKAQELEYKNRNTIYLFISITLFLAILLFVLYRSNQTKQKAKLEIEKSYDELKNTQTQLIQSEKMASLGELTAGIAHEIQNPLNFVNNFSEVSKELLVEMKEEIANKNYEEVEEISQDIDNNLEKINHHGKRAEAIVKGMLQHSRTNSGEKALTDINALADEYLRLSYHGLRAKDKSFNADFKLDADETLPKINVVPQDIGRVLLNLINNAFYAVDKQARTPQPPKGGTEENSIKYKPEVVVSTSFKPPLGGLGGQTIITVKDNGPGIPPEIKDKIFQPFFTTKPTGQGTGLGLSLSYDIVKVHGGTINIKSKEGEGTEFSCRLPIK